MLGGSIDPIEKQALRSNISNELKQLIIRRTALRETIEECGGGYCTDLENSMKQVFVLKSVPSTYIGSIKYRNIVLPPNIFDIIDDPSLTRYLEVPFGNGGRTNVFVYLIGSELDTTFVDKWIPRATPEYRAEICEDYNKGNCKYGYIWVDISTLMASPQKPFHFSTNPLCEFVSNIFANMQQDLIRCISELSSKFHMLQHAKVQDLYTGICDMEVDDVTHQNDVVLKDRNAIQLTEREIHSNQQHSQQIKVTNEPKLKAPQNNIPPKAQVPHQPHAAHQPHSLVSESISKATLLPPHTYIRLGLDSSSTRLITHLSSSIQHHCPDGAYFSQLHPQAGLGCHAFHITICSQLKNISCESILHRENGLLRQIASKYKPIQVALTPNHGQSTSLTFKVAKSSGNVSILLNDVNDCLSLGQDVVSLLPSHVNSWYVNSASNVHITIGRYVGHNYNRFVQWLNEQYSSDFLKQQHTSVTNCKYLICNIIEVSEECDEVYQRIQYPLIGSM